MSGRKGEFMPIYTDKKTKRLYIQFDFLGQTKPADIEKFKQHRANTKTQHDTVRKPATVLRELSIISKIFSMAVKNDFLEFNPCSRVEKPKFDNIQNRILR